MRYTISPILATLLHATAVFAEVPRVVADIPPVQSLVAMVMGDLGQPEVLVAQGADPHSFQLRPSQAASLQAAQLVIWIGPEMTPWLERILDGAETKATQIRLLEAAMTETLGTAEDSADDHAAKTNAAIEDSAENHLHQGRDPHAWLNPRNATAWLGLIAAELSTLDPANATVYAANAATGAVEILAAEAEIKALLAPVQTKPFVVYHDAYGYFAGHFGLTIAGKLALGDATSPSAAKLADLRQSLTSNAPACIFPEANHDPKLLLQITDGTPIMIGGALDPEGSALPPGAALYTALMRALATTLSDCLSKS